MKPNTVNSLERHKVNLTWIDKCLAQADPKKPFIVSDDKPFSYGGFSNKVKKLTAVLLDTCDTTRGMAIVTQSPVEMTCLFVAALRAGIPVINVNPDLTSAEFGRVLRSCDVSHVFIDAELAEKVELADGLVRTIIDLSAPQKIGLVGRLLGGQRETEALTPYEAMIEAAQPMHDAPSIDPDQTAMLLMTSGTTSDPKVVELSHKNIAAQLYEFSLAYDLDAKDRVLNPLPLHFTDGILHGPLHTLFAGATLFRPSKFSFEKLDDLLLSIYRDRITHFFTVPAVIAMINNMPDSFNDAFSAPDFKMIRASGDRLSDQIWDVFEERFSVKLSNAYGLSETVSEATYCTPQSGTYRKGTIGRPIGCGVRIVADDGSEVEAGETGELVIKGDVVAKGYRNNKSATQEAFVDGWFKTGDLAIKDDDGYLTVVGRKSRVIISGGININPSEVSDVLMGHQSVDDAAAFGLEDLTFGEKVIAAVRTNGAQTNETDLEIDLLEWCRKQLAPHKLPREILVLKEIPRTPSGKVIVRKLREIATQRPGKTTRHKVDFEKDIILLAAEVFNCDSGDLNLRSAPKSTLGWDSFAHVQLILEAEKRYALEIPPREFLSIKTLGDLANVLKMHNE